MSDYTKTTNFTAKDSLPTGNTGKLIKGSEHDTEFNNIATAIATKANKISGGTANNVVEQDANGDLVDTGLATPTGAFVGVSDVQTLTNKTLTSPTIDLSTVTSAGDLAVADGGTGASTAAAARANLGVETFTVLDTPEQLVASMTEDAWTTVDSSTLSTAQANKAVLKIVADVNAGLAIPGYIKAYIRKTGSALAKGTASQVMWAQDNDRYSGTENTKPAGVVQFVVNLDGSYDFDYYIEANLTMSTKELYLVGYYS